MSLIACWFVNHARRARHARLKIKEVLMKNHKDRLVLAKIISAIRAGYWITKVVRFLLDVISYYPKSYAAKMGYPI